MSNNLLFDFAVDKAAKTIVITREFNAALAKVWDAFTVKELIDRWSAPAPMRCHTKHMNFEVGGKRFYAMVMPDGTERHVLQTYTSITPKTNFKLHNAFADDNENPEPTGSERDHNFGEENGKTKVIISIYNESLERMEKLADGFRLGYTAMLGTLEELLATL